MFCPQIIQLICCYFHLITGWIVLLICWSFVIRVFIKSCWFFWIFSWLGVFFLQFRKILPWKFSILFLYFKQVSLLTLIILLPLLLSSFEFLHFLFYFFLLSFKHFHIVNQILIDIMLKNFLLIFFNVFHTINFFHCFTDNSVQICDLIFHLLHFGMSNLGFFPCI